MVGHYVPVPFTYFLYVQYLDASFLDSQVVSHVFRLTRLGGFSSGFPCDSSSPAPSPPPRRSPRNLLLYYHGLAQLALGKTTLLVNFRKYY